MGRGSGDRTDHQQSSNHGVLSNLRKSAAAFFGVHHASKRVRKNAASVTGVHHASDMVMEVITHHHHEDGPVIDFNTSAIGTLYNVESRVLGTSGSTVVTRATRVSDGVAVAIKSLPAEDYLKQPDRRVQLAREIEIMQSLRHDAVVNLLDAFHAPGGASVQLALELCPGGDLHDFMTRNGGACSEWQAQRLMRQLLTVLAYIHGEGVIHRDLKLENVFCVDKSFSPAIKLADFGFAKRVKDLAVNRTKEQKKAERGLSKLQRQDSVIGTPGYLAPEVSDQAEYDVPVDIFAAGVVMFALLAGRLPFEGAGAGATIAQTKAGKLEFDDPPWATHSIKTQALVRKMLDPRWKRRPTADALAADEWCQTEAALRM